MGKGGGEGEGKGRRGEHPLMRWAERGVGELGMDRHGVEGRRKRERKAAASGQCSRREKERRGLQPAKKERGREEKERRKINLCITRADGSRVHGERRRKWKERGTRRGARFGGGVHFAAPFPKIFCQHYQC